MYSVKKIHLLLLFSMQLVVALGQENAAALSSLNEVIVAFEKSIEEKDSVRFKQLFFQDKTPFTGIMSEKTEMSIKKNYPEFEGIAISNSSQFIQEICKTEKAQKETFYNVEIETDGVIASIHFDYTFQSGEKMIQWGKESWNLVKEKGKWLITDVIYSIRFPDVEECLLESVKE